MKIEKNVSVLNRAKKLKGKLYSLIMSSFLFFNMFFFGGGET